MYSYQDRIRAVELYIKLGQRVGPTIRQLGYTTKNALKGWYHEYQLPAHEEPADYLAQVRIRIRTVPAAASRPSAEGSWEPLE